MLQFISLSSGSSGNCYYLRCGDYALLIDLGIGIRNFKKFCRQYALSIPAIRAILVTHDHADHAKAVGALSKEFNLPVYTSPLTHEGILRNRYIAKKIPTELCCPFLQGETLSLGPFTITSFDVPHDSVQNNGFFIVCENKHFCLITDIGHTTEEMATYVKQADFLVFESNFDRKMLETGPYPAFLQARIASPNGHLSNDEAASFLADHLTTRTSHLWLCHLSQENNQAEIAHRVVKEALLKKGLELHLQVLPRKLPGGLFQFP